MGVDPFVLSVFATVCGIAGVWMVVIALRPGPMKLVDALALLDPDGPVRAENMARLIGDDAGSRWERLGARIYRSGRIPMSTATLRQLAMQGRSIGDFLVEKTVLMLGGLVLPGLVSWVVSPWAAGLGVIPLGAGVFFAIIGWWWPDIVLKTRSGDANADSRAALNTFFDLMVLARLANLSVPQSLAAASEVSDAPLFLNIRGALERARLSQQAPQYGLQSLARELEMPELADLADLLRLDEQGAPLAELLTARVSDLRDAHLNQEKAAAHAASEQMSVWMSIPVVLFSLAFLIPPLLALLGQ